MQHGHSGYCAPEKDAKRDRCHAHLTPFIIALTGAWAPLIAVIMYPTQPCSMVDRATVRPEGPPCGIAAMLT